MTATPIPVGHGRRLWCITVGAAAGLVTVTPITWAQKDPDSQLVTWAVGVVAGALYGWALSHVDRRPTH